MFSVTNAYGWLESPLVSWHMETQPDLPLAKEGKGAG